MFIKSELSGCKIELIDCFGEHQSQLFYNRIRIYNPCWIKYGKSQFDVKLGYTIPLDLSNDKNIPILCTPIHFFQRLHDKQQSQQQQQQQHNRNSTSGYIQSKHSDSNVVHRNNKGTTGLMIQPINDSCKELSNSLTNNIDTMENVSNDNFITNDALATIRVYFPVKLMKSANELKISSDLKKRFHLLPHLHEFVAYPELLTLPIDQLSTCILKGLSMVHSLIQYTLSVPKELYIFQKNHLTAHGTVHNTNDNDNENGNKVPKSDENNESTSPQESRFIIVNRGIYNRLNALIQIQSTEKMIIMPKRIQWSLGLINNRKNSSLNQKFIDFNNLTNSSSSQLTNKTNRSISSLYKELLTNSDDKHNDENIIHNSNQNRADNHNKVINNNFCNGYLRNWVGLSISDHDGDGNHNYENYVHVNCSTMNKTLNNTSSSSLSTLSSSVNGNDNSNIGAYPSATERSSLMMKPNDHSISINNNNNNNNNNNIMNSIRIAFVRRESSECGNAIDSCFLQNKYSPAKLRRSRLRGTDSLVIKFKRHNLSRNYYPSELVPNSIVQYNEQSNCDKFFNPNTIFMTTNTTSTITTTNTSVSSDSSSNNSHNNSTEKRMRCDQNKILCILTSPLNYSSNYYPRNTCYDSYQNHPHHYHHNNRLLSPTTLTTSSIASRVKWGANLTLLSNSLTNFHDTNDNIQTNYPVNHQYDSESNTKELNQFTNEFNTDKNFLSHHYHKIILHPRPRIPPKRLDLANQDLELALKRSLSDCTMQSSNKNYHNRSIKKSLAYTVRLNSQHTGNRDSTNKNLVRRTKAVLRSKRKRHKTFTNSRRQKSKTSNVKGQRHKSSGKSPIPNSTDSSSVSTHSRIISDDSVINDLNENGDRLMNDNLSRLPLPKLTLAKNSVGEFNVVENREENTGKFPEICDRKTTTNNRMATSMSNSNIDNSVLNSCQAIISPSSLSSSSTSSKVTICKSLKRKSDNKQRANCLNNDRIVNKISQINSEVLQDSNDVDNINIDELKHSSRTVISSVDNLEQMATTATGSIKTDEEHSTSTTNYGYTPVVDCVVSNKSTTDSTNLSSVSPEQVTQWEIPKSTSSLTDNSTALGFVQSVVHNTSANPSYALTITPSIPNQTSCGHSTNFTSQHQNISHLSPINPVTMWSRLSNPLPAPDPPTKLFNTKRVPFQHPPQLPSAINNQKFQQFPVIGSGNSICSTQGIPQTLVTNHLPYHITSNSTTIPIDSVVHLPADAYLKQNMNTNVMGLATNPLQYSTLCNPSPLNDLNSKQFLQNLNKMQLSSQLYSSFPTPMHLSLPPSLVPTTQFSLVSSSSSPAVLSTVFNSGNQIHHWQCTNFPSNSNISKLTGNIPVGYDTTSLLMPSGNPILNNSNNSNNIQNGFLSYPFLLPNSTFTNIGHLNLCNSTPLLGACPSSLQSILGASYILGAQNFNNNNNGNNNDQGHNLNTLQNCIWLP
uniref:CABIT domain-containing protein n=1 Tax=Schistosoma mansoni TaxID=6183 RepID=A0A5K4F2M7_SCHMA